MPLAPLEVLRDREALGRVVRGQGFKIYYFKIIIILFSGGREPPEAETKVCFVITGMSCTLTSSLTAWGEAAPTHIPLAVGSFLGHRGELASYRDKSLRSRSF